MMVLSIVKYLILFLTAVSNGYHDKSHNEPVCTDCHSDLVSGSVKHPDLETSCDLCHASTGEEHPGDAKGFSLADEMPSLCYMCHDDLGAMEYVHYPVSEGDCMSCHSPHSTERKGLLINELSDNICLDCHDMEITDERVVHKPLTSGRCTDCHDPHQSVNRAILLKSEADICTTCHSSMISGKKSVHAPAASGECLLCHSAHTSANRDLLTVAYPEKLYTESSVENFELCFQCHDSEMILSPETTYATNFRDKTRNLHYLHINGTKGRNCNVCHDMHASDLPFILNKRIKFGEWYLTIRFEKDENGATCNSGCHSPKKYNRD